MRHTMNQMNRIENLISVEHCLNGTIRTSRDINFSNSTAVRHDRQSTTTTCDLYLLRSPIQDSSFGALCNHYCHQIRYSRCN